VFKLFDNLMLLAEGEMVYQGPASKGVDYFAAIGFQCEPFNNPCDFFMDVVCDQVGEVPFGFCGGECGMWHVGGWGGMWR
jgi:hypothetical protein